MANTYFKILNNSTQSEFKGDVLLSVQSQLKSDLQEILYHKISAKHYASDRNCNDLDVNTLLKYYLLEQLSTPTRGKDINLEDTANPDIKKCTSKNMYYMLFGNEYKYIPKIVSVNDDGTYLTIEAKSTSKYKIERTYSISHLPLKIRLISPSGEVITDKWQVVEILGLKKEYMYKYKYSGYSGNSSDVVSTLLNHIIKPMETGLYMDTSYHFYKWNDKLKAFEISEAQSSPMLTDYEFTSSNIVIRREYLGAA